MFFTPKSSLNANINAFFNDMPYFYAYNTDIWITIVVISLVLLITIYFFYKNTVESYKVRWEEKRCNPSYMAFGSMFNKNAGDNFNQENFEQCTNNLLFGISLDFKNPISAIFSIFGGIFALASNIMRSIMGFFLYLFNLIMELFMQLLNIIKKIIASSSEVFLNVANIVGNMFGFVAVLYNQIQILVDSVRFIFPILSAAFIIGVVLPVIAFLIFSVAMLIIGYILSNFFCMGCPIVAVFLPITIIVIFVLMFLLMIAHVLTKSSDEICNMVLRDDEKEAGMSCGDFPTPEEAQEEVERRNS